MALTEGMSGEDEGAGGSMEDEEEVGPEMQVTDSSGTESAVLEKLARAGHWQRCLAHAGTKAPHYAFRYAAHLLKVHPRTEGIDIESDEAPESLTQVLEVLRQYIVNESAQISNADAALAKSVYSEILVRVSLAPKALTVMQDVAAFMVTVGAEDMYIQAITLLMALHVPQIATKAARSLPRYTNIIVADVAYWVCGTAVRGEGSGGAREAFVLLNRALDLAEAADDDSAHLLDYIDFECTDWSRSPLLLENSCLTGAALDEAREWVLAVSMDQSVEQTLPVDSRGLYASTVGEDEPCCVLTGYPLGSRLVTFTNGRCANREWYSRVHSAARGGGPAAALTHHLTQWCGPADYTHI